MGDQGRTIGGPRKKQISIAKLKAFIAIHLYIGIKCQPNFKNYWQKRGSIFSLFTYFGHYEYNEIHAIEEVFLCDKS